MDDYRPFSEREGFVPMKVYQVGTIDADTRGKIYNKIYNFLHPSYDPYDDTDRAYYADKQAWDIVYRHHFWAEFCSQPVDEYMNRSDCDDYLKTMLLRDDPWHKVFDFLEYIFLQCTGNYENEGLNDIYSRERGGSLIRAINSVLKESNVGYSIIDNRFVPILPEQEKQEVEKACNTALHGANQHIKKAINFLADRKSPDYENSIKESISAVESIAKEITKKKEKPLNAMTQSLHLHQSFKDGLDKLYTWTSKDGGIRHGISGTPLTQDENTARFMLVVCSSFVNYIISRNPEQKGQ